MKDAVITRLREELQSLREQGLYKPERVLEGPQGGVVEVAGRAVINLCANNYLGLANHPAVRAAAQRSLDDSGYGMASVRFICGTQQTHKELERRLARFLGMEDAILYSSCFDANGGLFETLLDERDAVISDALNHACIIDGIRLCKAQRFRYANSDMAELERCLREPQGARTAPDRHRRRVLDGRLHRAPAADLRPGGSATTRSSWWTTRTPPASWAPAAAARPSTAASRSASTSSPAPWARPWAARAAATSRRAARWSSGCGSAPGRTCSPTASRRSWRRRAWRCSSSSSTPPSCARACSRTRALFREGLTRLGFDLKPGEHPIIPVMLGEAALAGRMAERLLEEGVYVIGFSYPVVPRGRPASAPRCPPRTRRAQLEQALEAFARVGRELGVIR